MKQLINTFLFLSVLSYNGICSTTTASSVVNVSNYPCQSTHLFSITQDKEISLENDLIKIRNWQAGEKVSAESVKVFGEENCFQQLPINDQIFKRIYKKSYKADCIVPKNDLRYLKILHFDLQDRICLGELICHKDISIDLITIFSALYKAHYPIERMVLIDTYNATDELSMRDNNTSCFNFRRISGTNVLSNHSTGHAIDINPLYNPYCKKKNGKSIYQPQTAKQYLNRQDNFPYKITKGDLCYKLFKEHGFVWGGDWNSVKDYQHFEKLK